MGCLIEKVGNLTISFILSLMGACPESRPTAREAWKSTGYCMTLHADRDRIAVLTFIIACDFRTNDVTYAGSEAFSRRLELIDADSLSFASELLRISVHDNEIDRFSDSSLKVSRIVSIPKYPPEQPIDRREYVN
jgi:hypothetical protein